MVDSANICDVCQTYTCLYSFVMLTCKFCHCVTLRHLLIYNIYNKWSGRQA